MKYCNKEMTSKIDKFIEKYRENIVDDLLKLVKIPSVEGAPRENAPYGRECARALEEVAELYRKNGFETKINVADGYTVACYGGGEKEIGIFSHADVVPAGSGWLITLPFEPVVKDGCVFGRGCNDDKSGIVETIYAAKIIHEMGIKLNSHLTMFTGSNEESGMRDIKAFASKEHMPDVSIVPDGEYPCVCGEANIMDFALVSRESLKFIKEFRGGEASNIILGRAEAEVVYSDELWSQLENICRNNSQINVSRNGNLINVKAEGIGKHIMDADQAVNAGKVLADVFAKCDAINEDLGVICKLAGILNGCHGEGLGIENDDEFFGKLICGNGIISLCDDGRLKADFNVRSGLSYSLDEMEKDIKQAVCDSWDYISGGKNIGYKTPDDGAFKKAAEKIYAFLSGDSTAVGLRIAGGTYARSLKNAYPIGTAAPYKAVNLNLPDGHGGVHQKDEKISVDALLEGVKILILNILEFDEILSNEK